MPDAPVPPPRKTALDKVYVPGDYGRLPADGPGIVISERRSLAITQVAAYADTAEAVSRVIAEAVGVTPPSRPVQGVTEGGTDVLGVGPHRWWIVGPEDEDPAGLLAAALGDHAAVTAQGHGRTALRLQGPRVRDLLAKGCTLDLHPSAFPAGASVQTSLAHMSAGLYCRGDGAAVDVYVMRSFGQHFFEWLTESAAEYGYRIADPG